MAATKIEFMTSRSDTMLDYRLFQKLKLFGYVKFNHLLLTITLGSNGNLGLWFIYDFKYGIGIHSKFAAYEFMMKSESTDGSPEVWAQKPLPYLMFCSEIS